jgi:hypothetical protein
MVSYDYTGDRITSLENDRKQIQTRLENLQYAITVLENQLNNNDYDKQIKEIYKNIYCIVVGIVIFVLYIIRY